MPIFEAICPQWFKRDLEMIKLYWKSFLIAICLVTIAVIPIVYWVVGLIYQIKIDTLTQQVANAVAKPDFSGTTDRLLKQEVLAKVRLLRSLHQFIDDKKEGREIATHTAVNYISTHDNELFERECPVRCTGLREALLGRLGQEARIKSSPNNKYYSAPFGLEMLKGIADDLEYLAEQIQA